jgi:hypothetical protein
MGTLTIVRQLLLYANWPRHPLVRRESEMITPWAGIAAWLLQAYRWIVRGGLAIVLLAIGLELVHQSSLSVFMTLMLIFMPIGGFGLLAVITMLLISWPIPLVFSGSIGVLRERTAHTWELLLLTPLPRSELLLSKLAVGLSRQQPFLTVVTLLQVIPWIVLLGAVSRYMTTQVMIGCAPLAILVLTTLLFVIDRVQQLIFVSLIGLATGLLADNWAIGLIGAAALGAVFWLIHSAAAFLLVYIMAGARYFDPAQAIFVGFPALASSPYIPGVGLGVLFGVIIIQECCVRGLFSWLEGHCSR